MTATKYDLHIIASWLANLAELTRHGDDGKLTEDKLAIYSTLLGKDFPSTAFTVASLHHAAQGCEWWPSYDAVRRRISEWWREHRPCSALALSAPYATTGADLTGIDRLWLDCWYRRTQEIATGKPASGNGPEGRDAYAGHGTSAAARRNLASLIRQQSPRAWAVIAGGED
jgi:hypothetical protein